MEVLTIINTLKNTEVFSKCSSLEMSRLASFIDVIKLKKGECLYKKNQISEKYYYLLKGKVRLTSDNKEHLIDKGFIGQEGVIGPYKFDAEVLDDIEVVVLSSSAFDSVFDDKTIVLDKLYRSFMNYFSFQKHEEKKIEEEHTPQRSVVKLISFWSLVVIVPVIVSLILPENTSWGRYYFLVMSSAILVLWIFNLIPFYLPMFMLLLGAVVLQIVPKEIIGSGLSSNAFILAVSIWGLAIVIFDSFIYYRVFLWVIKILPKSFTLYLWTLVLINFLITPFLPISALKYRMFKFLENEVSKVLKLKEPNSKLSVIISIFFQFGPFFLTGAVGCFIIYTLLPPSDKYLFTWLYWCYCTMIIVGLYLFLLLFVIYLYTRKIKVDGSLKKMAIEQLNILGRIKGNELFSLIGILMFIVGIIILDFQHNDISLASLGLLIFLLISGTLDVTRYEQKVNWALLLYIGISIGFIQVFNYLQIPQWLLGNYLNDISMMIKNNFFIFIAALGVIVAFLDLLFFPLVQLTILLCFIVPIAYASNINFWVIAMIAFIFTQMYWPVFHCIYFKKLKNQIFGNVEVDNKKFTVIILSFNFIVILGIYVSVYFWRKIGLM